MKENIEYPNEAFGHCDVGTAEDTCKNCQNYPNECSYMEMTDEDGWTVRSRKFDWENHFEKYIKPRLSNN